ncbi:hypothetical protein [Noviherbaspirillum suwonense]|jgi:hypothetical protein|uniref:Uncharacterized protein n=1 Tax=Noviherbaspirillum suwonense TaxID=1224511 RepID=A0ABY1QIG2_9BURK|nr:hypothetical protein [Noviherbaspirillum suwonense]SMP71786.1 hypothetical protein SAMN06295970_11774 [Noviherbaspirillum suwonense]
MTEPFASIADIKARVAQAFAEDQAICACPYPAESEAAALWRAEYVALSNQAWGRVAA